MKSPRSGTTNVPKVTHWGIAMAESRVRDSGARRWAAVVARMAVIFGGILIVGGSLLPWNAEWGMPLFAFAWEGGGGGLLIIVESFVVLVAGLTVVVGGFLTGRRPSLWKVTLIASVAAGLVGWADFQDALRRFGGFSHPPGVWAHGDEMGIGVACIFAGAAVGTIASVTRGRTGRRTGPPV